MASFLLRVTEQERQFKVNWTIIDGAELLAPPAYLVDAGLLQQAASNVRLQLKAIADAEKPFEKPEFATLLKQLAQLGRTLFKTLMDRSNDQLEVLQRFQEIATSPSDLRHDFNIVLDTAELFAPWGLVFSGQLNDVPKEADLKMSLADMMGFWLSHFNISVTYRGTSRLPRQRKTTTRKLFALHEEMFTEAKALLKAEDEECLERLEQLLDDSMPPAMDWDTFRDAW
jgi:hypothetical protein